MNSPPLSVDMLHGVPSASHHINGNCVLVGPPSGHQKSISSCYATLSDYEAFSQNKKFVVLRLSYT